MDESLQKQLFEKYPKIFKINNPKTCPLDQRGIECGSGWYNIIKCLMFEIQSHVDKNNLPQPECSQIKEKFGLLRIYTSNRDSHINFLLNNAEEDSINFCEKCGTEENVAQNKSGYIETLCRFCRKKNNEVTVKYIAEQLELFKD